MTKTAVIGAGLIGRAWAIVFARGGFDVWLHDPAPGAVGAAIRFADARLPELHEAGLLGDDTPETVRARLHAARDLGDALSGAAWVQENGPERVDAKRELFAEMDRRAAPDAILASSTSAIPASEFTGNLAGRGRCLVAHPVNPPYLVPVVELCPAPWTDPEVVERARALMRQAGMVPATVNREIQGFILNRLQAALLGEAFRLVEDGIASPEDVDATVKHGLGLRWSFMGPFETIDLNAPGGLEDYCARYGTTLLEMRQQMTPRPWTKELVAKLEADRRETLPREDHAARQEWRDRRLMGLLAHKAAQKE
jgi:L-gulonate 3-dehydrogenase